jgi:uncharacterized membrane protein
MPAMTDSQTYDATPAQRVPDASLVQYTHIIYGLHALSVLIGVLGSATIVGSFVFGLPSIVAVVMNYVRRSDARGTMLESHFEWQIRTFWIAFAIMVVAFMFSLPLMIVLIGFVTFGIAAGLTGIWVIYRVVKGWLALRDGKVVA